MPYVRIFGPPALMLAAFVLVPGPVAAQTPAQQERIAQCKTCHGADGNSTTDNMPSLAGQPEFFILNQLVLLREGVRKVEPMVPFVKDLKDEDIQALAAYFSALPATAAGAAPDPARVEQGARLAAMKRCDSCHGPALAGDRQIPRIARQRIDYMRDSLKAYRDNTRTGADTAMSAMIFGLTDADLEALAHYAASR